jgi:hypothetical protein
MRLCTALLALLLLSSSNQTLLTRDGKKYVGKVTASGTTVSIETLAGKVDVPADKVACVFTEPRDAAKRADDLYELAKKTFEQARDLGARDPRRNPQLQAAIDILSQARDIYDALNRHYEGPDWAFLSRSLSTSMQLMRLIRDQKGSDIAGGVTGDAPTMSPLASGDYVIPVPAVKEKKYAIEGDLGAGQLALEKGLESEDPRARAETLKKLASPASPHALPAVMALLERETNDEVLRVLGESLVDTDLTLLVKPLSAFAKKVTAPTKRLLITAILKGAGDKAACDLLVDWLVESPPNDDRIRAAIASALRKMRDSAVKALKEELTKTKDRRVQTEVFKQLGAMADKRNAPLLVAAIPTFRSAGVAGLIDIGRPGLPAIIQGVGSGDADQKKYCVALAKKLSGTDRNTSAEFAAWYNASKKQIDADEDAFWADQAAKDYPVDPRIFRDYDRRPEEVLRDR